MVKKSSVMLYEDGTPTGKYTVIPNDVLDRMTQIELTHEELSILTRVIRDTIGYEITKMLDEKKTSVRRLSYEIPLERFKEKTKLSTTKINKALESLEKRSIISRSGNLVTFNNKLNEWYPKTILGE